MLQTLAVNEISTIIIMCKRWLGDVNVYTRYTTSCGGVDII